MHYSYQTSQTCSQHCHGNLQGVSRLVEGMEVNQVLERLEGIRCGWKDTSCPDQLCQAIRQAMGDSPVSK